MAHCCDPMQRQVALARVAFKGSTGMYFLPVGDQPMASVLIHFCPWCRKPSGTRRAAPGSEAEKPTELGRPCCDTLRKALGGRLPALIRRSDGRYGLAVDDVAEGIPLRYCPWCARLLPLRRKT